MVRDEDRLAYTFTCIWLDGRTVIVNNNAAVKDGLIVSVLMVAAAEYRELAAPAEHFGSS